MRKANKVVPIFLVVMMILLVGLSACDQTTYTDMHVEPEVVVITKVVTQVYVPTVPTSTPTPVPTGTPAPVMVSSGWNPYAVPIYYPIIGCSASRLHMGDTALIVYSGGRVGLYNKKEMDFNPIMKHPPAGSEVEIIGGPWCDGDTILWKVLITESNVQAEGYFPEGNGEEYWLLPLAPAPHPEEWYASRARILPALDFTYYGCNGRNRK
jgi:hypothetical protein